MIDKALVEGLSIFKENGPARCRGFLAESPLHTKKREELKQRRQRLELAKEAISKFGSARH